MDRTDYDKINKKKVTDSVTNHTRRRTVKFTLPFCKSWKVLWHADGRLTRQQIARLAGLKPDTVANHLRHLRHMGLLDVWEGANAFYYRVSPNATIAMWQELNEALGNYEEDGLM